MDLEQKVLEAIKKAEQTDRLEILSYHFSEDCDGIIIIDVVAHVFRRRMWTMQYQLVWNEECGDFAEVTASRFIHRFDRYIGDIKRSQQITRSELFSLLRKANRRRKTAEDKVRKLRGILMDLQQSEKHK